MTNMNLVSTLKSLNHSALSTILLSIVTLISLYMAYIDFRNLLSCGDWQSISQTSSNEIPIPTLNLEHAAMMFKTDAHYPLSSDKGWDSLTPSGNSGFVRLNDTSNPFLPSLYHQVHCLNNLRKIFTGPPGWEGDIHKEWHVKHCLNLLLRAVLCNADTTLEPSFDYVLPNGQHVPASHGHNVLHRCRDWTAVRTFVENNYRAYRHVPFESQED